MRALRPQITGTKPLLFRIIHGAHEKLSWHECGGQIHHLRQFQTSTTILCDGYLHNIDLTSLGRDDNLIRIEEELHVRHVQRLPIHLRIPCILDFHLAVHGCKTPFQTAKSQGGIPGYRLSTLGPEEDV